MLLNAVRAENLSVPFFKKIKIHITCIKIKKDKMDKNGINSTAVHSHPEKGVTTNADNLRVLV
jgi:hypothetical protein